MRPDLTFTSIEQYWMNFAISLASRGLGHVEPNPMVGCVIVGSENRLLAAGWHERFGEAHAEVNAIADTVQRGLPVDRLRSSTMFVTLEPCCHRGKTPPCTQAIIESGIQKVVVACSDPFHQVDGGGILQLERAGIQVRTGLLAEEAKELNRSFF